MGRNSIIRSPNSFFPALGQSSKISFQNKHSSPETVVVLYQCLISHKRKVKKRHCHVWEDAFSKIIFWTNFHQVKRCPSETQLYYIANVNYLHRCFQKAYHFKLNIAFVNIGFWQVNWRWKPYLVLSALVVNSEKKVLDSNVSQLWAASLNPGRSINGKRLNLCY